MSASRAHAALRGATASMAGIALAELNATAALTERTDVKYLVPTSSAIEAIAVLSRQGGRVLDIDGQRGFRYRSTYFDTPDLWTYRTHRQGRRRRVKVRTRVYLDSGLSFLEVKLSGGAGTDKHRVAHPEAMTETGRVYVERVLARARRTVPPGVWSPSLRIGYSRFTLLTADGSSRVTCDVDLAWRLPDGRGFAARDDLVLIEVKTPPKRPLRLPCLRRPRGGLSKYCVGITALRPDLAGNPWYRTVGVLGQPSRPAARAPAGGGAVPPLPTGRARPRVPAPVADTGTRSRSTSGRTTGWWRS